MVEPNSTGAPLQLARRLWWCGGCGGWMHCTHTQGSSLGGLQNCSQSQETCSTCRHGYRAQSACLQLLPRTLVEELSARTALVPIGLFRFFVLTCETLLKKLGQFSLCHDLQSYTDTPESRSKVPHVKGTFNRSFPSSIPIVAITVSISIAFTAYGCSCSCSCCCS